MKNREQFFGLIKRQFVYGGEKYAQTKEKEATDVLFDDFGKNWLFGTIAKYVKRYSNLARERDLLKIACYMFILWLKRGFHLEQEGTSQIINTTVETKSKYFETFIDKVKINRNYDSTNPMGRIYNLLNRFANKSFQQIKEWELLEIFEMAYIIWNKDIKEKGGDEDVYNETKGEEKK